MKPITPPTPTPATLTNFEVFFAKDRAELSTYTLYNMEVEGSYLGDDGVGVGSLISEAKFSATTMFMIATVRVQKQQFSVDINEVALDTDALNKLDQSTEDFVNLYGGYYVSSLITGGLLFIIYEMNFKTIQTKLTAEASLSAKAKTGGWSSSSDFKAVIEAAAEVATLNLIYSAQGGAGPTSSDPDKVLKAALNFESTVTSDTATVIFVELSAFWKITNMPSVATVEQTIIGSVLNTASIAAFLEAYLDVQDEMTWANDNSSWIGLSDSQVSDLSTWITDIGKDISTLNTAWSSSSTYEIPDPSTLSFNFTPTQYEAKFESLDISSLLTLISNGTTTSGGDATQYFYLKATTSSNSSGDHYGPADSQWNGHVASEEYYPLMTKYAGAVKVFFKNYDQDDGTPIEDGNVVYIKSTIPDGKSSTVAYLGNFQTLDCYYSDDTDTNTRWKIYKDTSSGNEDDIIRYGDKVRLRSDDNDSYLNAKDDYPNLTASSTDHYYWEIESS